MNKDQKRVRCCSDAARGRDLSESNKESMFSSLLTHIMTSPNIATSPVPPTLLFPGRPRRAEPRPGQNPLIELHPLIDEQASEQCRKTSDLDTYSRSKPPHHRHTERPRAIARAPSTLVGEVRPNPAAGYSVIHATLVGMSFIQPFIPTYSWGRSS